jgi:hypothetical protein
MTNLLNRILGLVLITLLLISGVHASVNTQARDSCTELGIHTFSVTLDEGSTEKQTFRVTNNALEEFTIEYLHAYDLNSGIIVSDSGFERRLVGGNSTNFWITFNALKNSDLESATGYVDMFGQFQSGNQCSFEKVPFNITINQTVENVVTTPVVGKCSLVLSVPEKSMVRTSDSVNFYANNQSSQEVTLLLRGNNLDVFNAEVTIPGNTEAGLPVFFKVQNNAQQTFLVWEATSQDCTYNEQTTQLVNLDFDEDKPVVIPVGITDTDSDDSIADISDPVIVDSDVDTPIGSGTGVDADAQGAEGTPLSSLDPVSAALIVFNTSELLGWFLVLVIVLGAVWYRFRKHPQLVQEAEKGVALQTPKARVKSEANDSDVKIDATGKITLQGSNVKNIL